MKNALPLKLSVLAFFGLLLGGISPVYSAGSISLGDAAGFAVLAGTAITNTGPTALTGDIGVSPGTAITGFLPGTYSGTLHSSDAFALQAQQDATTAYGVLAGLGLSVGGDLTGQDLGGMVLKPGVYQFDSSAGLTGTLTLDGDGQIAPLFVFQIGSSLTTADLSSIVTTNGADFSNVYFQVGSSATLGVGSSFQGTLIAFTSDTLNTGATVNGQVIALNGAVTLDSNIVVVPEPGSLLLLGVSLVAMTTRRKRQAAQV